MTSTEGLTMNKIMTLTGSAIVGAIAVFLFFQIHSEREALLITIAFMAGIMTAILPAIDHIFPREERESTLKPGKKKGF